VKWLDAVEAAVTVCDANGVITYLNARAARMFKEQGGVNLVGKSLFDCHGEDANVQIKKMLIDRAPNTYTIEKNGKKKVIHQAPWYDGGAYGGIVEFVMEIPFETPHFIRDDDPKP